jgi:hypothetical protein
MQMRSTAAMIAALALAGAAGACGGGNDGGGGGGGGSSAAQQEAGRPEAGKPGGRVTFLTSGDVDYLDPGQT